MHLQVTQRKLNHLQHECTRIPSLVVSPGCSLVSPQGELPVGMHHPHWLRLQSKTKEYRVSFCQPPSL